MILLSKLAAVLLAATTVTQPAVLAAGTRIATELVAPVNSATAKTGDEFELRAVGNANERLNGAVIRGHITRVVQPHGIHRAEIDFLIDSITLASGAKMPIRAFVVSPNVVEKRTVSPAYVPPLTRPGPTPPNTTVWQTDIGGTPHRSAQTGGVAYASAPGKPIDAKAGAPVTIELAGDLQLP
jgi:hypothetical protein